MFTYCLELTTVIAPAFLRQFEESTLHNRVRRCSILDEDQQEGEKGDGGSQDEEEENEEGKIDSNAIFNKIRLGNYEFVS